MRSRDHVPGFARRGVPLVPLAAGIRAAALPGAAITFWLGDGLARDFRLMPARWQAPAQLLMMWALWVFCIVIAWRQVRLAMAQRHRGGTVISGGTDLEARVSGVEKRQDRLAEWQEDHEEAWRTWQDVTGDQPFSGIMPPPLRRRGR